jgi:hypothetical protein
LTGEAPSERLTVVADIGTHGSERAQWDLGSKEREEA